MNVVIDAELAALLPPLSAEARAQLEQSLLAEGCREPLVIWRHDGQDILLDGHNRYAICQSRGINCRVRILTTKEIPDRNAAVQWILRNQLGRRNLTTEQFTLYLGKLYNAQKPKQGGTGSNQHIAQTGHNGRSAQQLAKEHGVSEHTVRRAGKFAEAVEKAKERDCDIEAKVLKGEVSRQDVIEKAKPAKLSEPKLDPDGRVIPGHLYRTFEVAEQIKRLAREVTRVRTAIEQSAEAEPAAWSQIGLQDVTAKLKLVAEHLRLGAPYVVCVYCGGSDSESCRGCKGAGFLSKARVRCAPPELRTGKAEEAAE